VAFADILKSLLAGIKIRLALSTVGLMSAVWLTGCFRTTTVVQRTQAPDMYRSTSVENLQRIVSERDASIKTLTASVLLTASTGGGKEGQVITYASFKGYIFVRKPSDLRVIMQLPVIGSKALDMVSNGDHFTLVHATGGHGDVWMQGSNTITTPSKNGLENLRPPVFFDSMLVPGVAPDEFVALTDSTRLLPPEKKHGPEIEEPDYDLAVMTKGTGNMLHVKRLVHFSRVTLLPFQQDIYNDKGEVETSATYDRYQDFNGIQFPMLIDIKRPLDEYELKLQITKLTLNQPLENDQFELKIPEGVKVQQMQ
jgi:outer membrane lipoprotein-sorting protein